VNSGGASFHAPPPLAAREPTRRRWKLKKNRGSGMFPSPSVLLNRRRPAEQEKKHTPVDFSLLFLDLLKNFCHPFLPVCSASADGRSSGGAEEPLGRPRDGRRTALLEAVGFAGLWGRRSATAAGGRSLQAEGEARRRRRGWRADRRCCWCSVAAATDSEECGSVAAEAPVEARGEIGCGLEGKWSRCLLVIGQDK